MKFIYENVRVRKSHKIIGGRNVPVIWPNEKVDYPPEFHVNSLGYLSLQRDRSSISKSCDTYGFFGFKIDSKHWDELPIFSLRVEFDKVAWRLRDIEIA